MKPKQPQQFVIHLTTALTVASLAGKALAQAAERDNRVVERVTTSTSTSTSTASTGGQSGSNQLKITIEREQDGKKETRVIVLDPDTPPGKISELVGGIGEGDHGVAQPERRKVTFLGVMLAEPATATFSPFGSPPGGPRNSARKPGSGLPITGVSEGSPAESAGLKAGDVLRKLDDQILINADQFTALIHQMDVGQAITLEVDRDGESMEIAAELGSREEQVFSPGMQFPDFAAPGQANQPLSGQVFRLTPDGKVESETVLPYGSGGASGGNNAPTPPPHPGAVPHPPLAGPHRPYQVPWADVLGQAQATREQAMEEWKRQLEQWREQWVETQENTARETRKMMERFGEELRRASEAAARAQKDAVRALEAWEAKAKAKNNGQGGDPTDPAPEAGAIDDLELELNLTDPAGGDDAA